MKLLLKNSTGKKLPKTLYIQRYFLLAIVVLLFACNNPSSVRLSGNDLQTFYFVADENEALDLDIIAGVDHKTNTITAMVPFGTVVKNLKPAITHYGLSISPKSGVAQDFTDSVTSPITYTVTALDGKTLNYTVSISTLPGITTFAVNIAGTAVTGDIKGNTITLNAALPFGTNINTIKTATITTLTPSGGATADKKTADTLTFVDNEASFIVNTQDDTTIKYTIKLNLNIGDPKVTTYTKTNILGQAIKDDVLDDNDVIITIENLVAGVEFMYTLGSVEGALTSSEAGILEMKKRHLKNTNAGDNAVLTLTTQGQTANIATYKPFEISSWQDLQAMRQDLAADYVLIKNITFPDVNNDGKANDYNFFPIKGIDPYNKPLDRFSGSFDGKNHTINRLYIKRRNSERNIGLFGHVDTEGSVTDIGLIDNVVEAKAWVGGLVGVNEGTVRGFTTGNVGVAEVAGTSVGGLVGVNKGTVSGYTTGNVIGKVYVGGLVGLNGLIGKGRNVGTVSGYATGDVSGFNFSGRHVGGLVGNNYGTVSGYATGNVSGFEYVGGLVGNNSNMARGYATGNVSGNKYIGGLVGLNSINDINIAGYAIGYATGNVSGSEDVGGLLGWGYIAAVIGYARGTVTRTAGTSTNHGLLAGRLTGYTNTAGDVIIATAVGYHSAGESTFANITDADAEGTHGTAITIDTNTETTNFADFTFGTDLGEWTFTKGKWPSINMSEKAPADQPIDR